MENDEEEKMNNLLLLEEDKEARESLVRLLKKRGFPVVYQAESESSALWIISSRRIDLVIAGASERDRCEFLAYLRELSQHIPVVFLADFCGPEARLRGLAYGPFSMSRRLNFYINMRPIIFTELVRLIRLITPRGGSGRSMNIRAA